MYYCMLRVDIRLTANEIKKTIEETLDENSVKSKTEVSVAIIGDRKMTQLNKKYRNKDGTTNILSFPLTEGESTPMPSDITTTYHITWHRSRFSLSKRKR